MNTSRKKAFGESAKPCLAVIVLPSLRGALATKQSTFQLAAPWIASLRSQ
jgi:hypothetical protein